MKIKRLFAILSVLLLALSMMGASSSKTPAKVSGVKAISASDTAIGISWKSAKNAKKYEVKFKASSAKSWKSVTVSAKKTTIKNLKQNTKYQFKVRGINGSKKGSFSTAITQQTYIKPAQVNSKSIFAIERSRNLIKIEWAAAKNASTYEVATTRLNSSYTDYQYCEYENYKPTTHYTVTTSSPNTWYQIKVRSVNNKTGKFEVVRSAWSAPVYYCTTSGGRIITGTKDGTVVRYNMNDTFVVGVDDALVPFGVYEISSPPENYFESDYMAVNGVTFPSDFSDISEDCEDIEENLNGKTYTVGGTFEGRTIQNIIVKPSLSDGYGGNSTVSFVLSNNCVETVSW
ncbi:MAG: fibronectin type III domain-containing protein [Eubacterium sp.]|nr:fibronectin type III domain-containing protein [Eubacterium sp.]